MIVDLSKIKSGFSDKLRAISYVIAINKLSKKKSKIFYIYENITKECPLRFIDFCEIKNLFIKKLKKKRKTSFKFTSYNTEINLKNAIKNNPYNYIDNKKLLSEWKLAYQDIIPNNQILKKINLMKLPKNIIGLHLRTTDRTIDLKNFLKIQFKDMIYNFQLLYFTKKILKILKNYSNINNIFIAADEKNIKNCIIKELKSANYNVYYHEAKFRNSFRKTSGYDFMIDFFCLSNSKIIISTVGAGVVNSIKLIKNIKVKNWNNSVNIFLIFRIMTLIVYYLKIFKKKIIN